MASVAKVKALCLSLPGATHDVKWGKDHCFTKLSKKLQRGINAAA